MRFPRRLLNRSIVAVALLGLAAIVLGWSWRARNGHTLLLTTAELKHGDLTVTISATGTIEPIEVVDVGAQVAGLIKGFGKDKSGNTIDYGSLVEENTVLANIDDSVYAADLALARAQVEQDKAGELSAAASLEQMKAKLIQAEAEWKRAQELSRSKLISSSDYDTYKANYEIARANISAGEAAVAQAKAATVQAQAQLDKAQRNLDFCVIKSPVKGVIIDRRVNIGQTVVASFNAPSLFLIAKDLTKMQIWVAVNEADVGRVVPGTPVTFTCDTFPGREFTGTVGKVRLNATMTQNVVMYTVEVNTENPGNILLPYLTANVRFVVRSETNALLVPNAALRWSPSSPAQIAPEFRSWKSTDPRAATVWLKESEFVKPFAVKAGATDGANTVLLTDALHEGEEVVTGETVQTADSGAKNPFIPQFRKR
jgi:HlyD family secretion protein